MSTRNLSTEIYGGTAGGSLSGILAAISLGDVFQTVVLAIVGTIVSFFVSVCLKRLVSGKNRKQDAEG